MFYRANAWEDYTEYLLKNAELEIVKEEYTIDYTGEDWQQGRLELKNK